MDPRVRKDDEGARGTALLQKRRARRQIVRPRWPAPPLREFLITSPSRALRSYCGSSSSAPLNGAAGVSPVLASSSSSASSSSRNSSSKVSGGGAPS
jgi:hypothetical protein